MKLQVKEVIISFFMLMKQGNAISKEELDEQSEAFIKGEFKESCNFDVDDAVTKLEKLGIVTRDENGKYKCVGLKRANEIIGTTTEEVVLKVRGDLYDDDDDHGPELETELQHCEEQKQDYDAKEEHIQNALDEFESLLF